MQNLKQLDSGKASESHGEPFRPRSGAFTVSAEWRIDVPRVHSPPGRPSSTILDLRKLVLPNLPFLRDAQCVADRGDLRIAVVRALDRYMTRSSAGKQRHSTAQQLVAAYGRLFEYGWLRGAYALTDWTQALFDDLAADLASGGWYRALRIEERCAVLLSRMNEEERAQLWSIRRYSTGCDIHLAADALDDLRTNGNHWIRLHARRYLAHCMRKDIPELTVIASTPVRSGADGTESIARHTFRSANLLAAVEGGFAFLPYPNAESLATSKLFRPIGRTRSLDPSSLGEVLRCSHWWVFSVGPHLIRVLRHVATRRALWIESPKKLRDCLAECPALVDVEQLVGQSIRTPYGRGTSGGVSLRSVVEALMCACAVLLAVLNARRRDEILHPVIGLKKGSVRPVDETLGVYLCDFYIEKTAKTRVPFYVGPMTRSVVQLLEEIAETEISADLQPATGDREDISLFRVPLVPLGTRAPRWLNWNQRWDRVRLQKHVMKSSPHISLAAHMFRRAYALLFHYRFEEGTLHALSQQLGHLDVEMTRVYVSDVRSTPLEKTGTHLYGGMPAAHRRALEDESRILELEIRQVGLEKLRSYVESVLRGDSDISGAYMRLIQRVHQALSGRLDYCETSLDSQVRKLSAVLESRGHAPMPMKHGTCMAGGAALRLRGHCYSEEKGVLDRSAASANTCLRCPYQVVTWRHLESLRQEARALEELGMKAVNLRSAAARAKRDLLNVVIKHHELRLGRQAT